MRRNELKEWKPEVDPDDETVDTLVQAAYQEVKDGDVGDYAVGVDAASGVLVLSLVDDDGEIHVYECSIKRSNQDAAAMIAEGDAECAEMTAPKRERILA